MKNLYTVVDLWWLSNFDFRRSLYYKILRYYKFIHEHISFLKLKMVLIISKILMTIFIYINRKKIVHEGIVVLFFFSSENMHILCGSSLLIISSSITLFWKGCLNFIRRESNKDIKTKLIKTLHLKVFSIVGSSTFFIINSHLITSTTYIKRRI